MDSQTKSEVRDEMQIDWDVPIEMDDGLILRADVFRPQGEGKYPVILTYGPYGKGLSFQEGYETAWNIMVENHPDVAAGSTNKYQSWEVVDPEKWVPDGYICIRVDSRGCGRSPGYIDVQSTRERQDLYQCIEWAAVQPWSSGKVGLNGISYYAINQWNVAALQPPHLAAICIWEGTSDRYRDSTHHGGILSTFGGGWYERQVKNVQYGLGEKGRRSVVTGDAVSGPEELSDEERAKNLADLGAEVFENAMDGPYWRERSADFGKIEVPLLSAGNWGGHGLHLRGNIEGFTRSASKEKWLEVHGVEHWTLFYTDYGIDLQKRFFGHFLKGEDTGWKTQPRVQLQVRHMDKFVKRFEDEWPLARTQWTKFYLDPAHMSLNAAPPASEGTISYAGMGEGVTFLMPPFEKETEITGPSACKLFVSSESEDADLFLIVRLFTPDMREVTFQGALDPTSPIAHGWLRASHRKLDPELSLPYRPYHTHDEKQPLTPGEVYDLDIEVWPTCIVVPEGYRIGLTVRGKDYVTQNPIEYRLSNMRPAFTGVGPFLHDHPEDRPESIFGKNVTLHTGADRPAHIMLPIVPEK